MRKLNPIRKSKSGRVLLIQKHVIRQSYAAFSDCCRQGLESVVYWYGLEPPGSSTDIAMAVAIPNAQRHRTWYEIPAEQASEMGKAMAKASLVCLAQFHTHPWKNTRHSLYDDQNAISLRNGFLSLVAPDYGCRQDLELKGVSIHEAWDARWHLLAKSAGQRRIRIVNDVVDLRGGS